MILLKRFIILLALFTLIDIRLVFAIFMLMLLVIIEGSGFTA
jgi:hypothetical protein